MHLSLKTTLSWPLFYLQFQCFYMKLCRVLKFSKVSCRFLVEFLYILLLCEKPLQIFNPLPELQMQWNCFLLYFMQFNIIYISDNLLRTRLKYSVNRISIKMLKDLLKTQPMTETFKVDWISFATLERTNRFSKKAEGPPCMERCCCSCLPHIELLLHLSRIFE